MAGGYGYETTLLAIQPIKLDLLAIQPILIDTSKYLSPGYRANQKQHIAIAKMVQLDYLASRFNGNWYLVP